MHGWIKLKEKILQTNESSSNIPTTTSINGHTPRSSNNGERSSSSVSASPARSPSIVSLVSSEDESVSDNESAPSVISSSPSPSPVSPSPLIEKITNNVVVTRKPSLSSIPKSFDTPTTILMEDISDDDILLVDLDKPRSKPIETLAYSTFQDPIVPLATDLQSLPGHSDDELRDIRFLVYTNVETLSSHFHICLSLDRETIRTFDTTEQSSTNCLIKIFKLYYLKTFMKSLQVDKRFPTTFGQENKQLPLSLIDSTTAHSFPIDWNVNRRQTSSTHRHTPKNIFHILQLNPRKTFLSTDHPTITSTTSVQSSQIVQSFERVKDILARTYCPHMYHAIQSGYQFGCKSKLPNTQLLVSDDPQIITVKEMPLSPELIQPSLPITLRSSSPAPIDQTDAILFPPSPPSPKKQSRRDKSPEPSFSPIVTHAVIDDFGPVIIRESIVVLSRPSFPLPSPPIPDQTSPVISRKRKLSATTTKKPRGRPKKRIVSSMTVASTPSPIVQPVVTVIPPTPPPTVNHFEDITDSDSNDDPDEDNDNLPFQQPKPIVIQNGLRSNYYKTTSHHEGKITNNKRRRCQSSGALPPFYRGIFESDDDQDAHLDYQLPYDIFWFGQQQKQQKEKERRSTIEIFPISPALPDHSLSTSPMSSVETTSKKKKATQPKQKKPVPYKKIQRNQYTDQLQQKLFASSNAEKSSLCTCKAPDTCDDGSCLNKISFTECSTSCACGSRCSNQKIRKSQWFKHLEVFETSKYGQGLRTTATIPKGTFLCEYVGEIITEEKFFERMTNLYSKDEHHYTMKLTQNLVIDAYRMGNVARFANHSCSPNCEFQKWTVEGLPRMCMFSSRTIRPGEELTYDYNFQCFNTQSQQPCYCESPKCRGFIGAKQKPNGNSSIASTPESPAPSPHPSIINQRLSQKDRRTILQSSIFLLRNLRQVRARFELKKKTEQHKLKQQAAVATSSLFFAQNFYHPNLHHQKPSVPSLRKTPKLSHKEMFYLFYNHIRRSHFAKTGRIHRELIDDQCYYAQLAQLALVLNEIFDLILNYRCENEITVPSIALRKCPSKRLYPVYYEIISKPIDLTLMRNKLDQGEYSSFDLFEDDFLLLIQNAIHYCGDDSDVAPAVLELKNYFLTTIKRDYARTLNLFVNMEEEQTSLTNITTLEDFITRLHEREVRDGQIREILYDIIYNIDKRAEDQSPVNYKIVLANSFNNHHRSNRSSTPVDSIVHCRCGSVQDETSLVQCYACQLWQHVACVSTPDPSRPYYCFECQPHCETNPSACLKHNVLIETTVSPLQLHDDNHQSYSTLTRDDGFVIRINECYFVPKQDVKNIDPKLTSGQYDILFVERLWIDDYGLGQAAGFYYIRPNETYHEPHRKFFCNEVFRFPSSNCPLPISCFVRPCFVLDLTTYCKGKPISDNSSRVLASDLFICEYRVDKTARTFSRLSRAKYLAVNTKSYCFDTYLERLTVRRDYQPHQKKFQDHLYDNRRRSLHTPIRFVHKSLEEKRTRVNGFIEKIYCRKHHPQLVPDEMIYTSEFVWEPVLHMPNEKNQPRTLILSRGKKFPSPQHSSNFHGGTIKKKRRTISISSDDDCVELLNERDSQKSILSSTKSHREDFMMHDQIDRNSHSSAMMLGSPTRLLNLHPPKLARPANQQQNLAKKIKVNHVNGSARPTSQEGTSTAAAPTPARSSKSDTSLRCPLRQTLPIFKQPVTYHPTQRDEVKPQVTNNSTTANSNTSAGKPSEKTKPRQLFWEKRFQNIRPTDIDGQPFEHFKLPEQIKGVGLDMSPETVVISLATSLHLYSNSRALFGQNKQFQKNPTIYVQRDQPLIEHVTITDEHIRAQEEKVNELRRRIQQAMRSNNTGGVNLKMES